MLKYFRLHKFILNLLLVESSLDELVTSCQEGGRGPNGGMEVLFSDDVASVKPFIEY